MAIQFIDLQETEAPTKAKAQAQSKTPLRHSDGEGLTASVETLLPPLHRLDWQLKQIMEMSQLLKGTPLEGYLLGSTENADSLAATVVPGSPLAQMKAAFALSDFEVGVLVLAIAPELDRRYERLYAQLQANGCRRPTVGLAVDLLCCSVAEKEARGDRFWSSAPLVQHGLIQLKSAAHHHTFANGAASEIVSETISEAINLADSFTLNPAVSRYLLGQPMSLQLSAYCQLSYPTATSLLNNSPLLPDLIARLRAGSLPSSLVLNFIGTGTKAQSAQAIAAAIQQPLLTIKLANLFTGEAIAADEIAHIAKQVLLQARLWNAVLYIESEPLPSTQKQSLLYQRTFEAPATSSFNAAFDTGEEGETFCALIAAYPGIVIFTGQAPSVPNTNSHKGVISVPFVPLPIDTAYSHLHTSLEAARVTLGETEQFRQRLLDASLNIAALDIN